MFSPLTPQPLLFLQDLSRGIAPSLNLSAAGTVMLCNKHTPTHPRLHGFRHQAPASGSQVCGVSVLGRVCLGSSRLGCRSGPRVPRSRAAARGIFSPGPWQMPRRPNQMVQTLPKPLLTSCPLTFHWPVQPSVAVVGMYTPSLSARHHEAMWQGVRVDTGDSVPSTTLPEAPLNLPGLDHSLT